MNKDNTAYASPVKYWEDPFLGTHEYAQLQELDTVLYEFEPSLRRALARCVYLQIRAGELAPDKQIALHVFFDSFKKALSKKRTEWASEELDGECLHIRLLADQYVLNQAKRHAFFTTEYLVVWFVTQYLSLKDMKGLDDRFQFRPLVF